MGIKHIHVDPAVVGPEPDGPENGGDAFFFTVDFGDLLCGAPELFKGGFLRGVDVVFGDMAVDGRANAEIALIGVVQIGLQIGEKLNGFAVHAADGAIEGDPFKGEFAQVDFVAAVATGHVVIGFGQRVLRIGVLINGDGVMAHVMQPLCGVAAAIHPRRARGGANRQMDFAPLEVHVFHQLHARLARADNQRCPVWHLFGAAVINRMYLLDRWVELVRREGHDGIVIAARGNHDLICGVIALAAVHQIAFTRALGDFGDLAVFDNRRIETLCKGVEVIGDFLFDHKAVGIVAFVGEARQAALPVWGHKAEGIPAVDAPRVEGLVTFQNDVIHAFLTEIIADGQSCLTAADNEDGFMHTMGHVGFLMRW